MYEVTDATRVELISALLAQFDKNEMIRFVQAFDPKFAIEVDSDVSLAGYVESVVRGMERRRIIGRVFFESWRSTRESCRLEIDSIEARILNRSGVTATSDLSDQVAVYGDPDLFRLICKAQGANFVKSTKAMEVPGGCVVQVSTREVGPQGLSVAEAVSFVPGVRLDANGDGTYRLSASS
jgi:hypothetical protein